jgi:hypothetical protein
MICSRTPLLFVKGGGSIRDLRVKAEFLSDKTPPQAAAGANQEKKKSGRIILIRPASLLNSSNHHLARLGSLLCHHIRCMRLFCDISLYLFYCLCTEHGLNGECYSIDDAYRN